MVLLRAFRDIRHQITKETVSLPSPRSVHQRYKYDPIKQIRESHRWLGALVGGAAGVSLGVLGCDILPEAMPGSSDNKLFWATMLGMGVGAAGFVFGHYPIQFINRQLILSELNFLSAQGLGRDRDDANMALDYLRDQGEI